MSKKFRFIESVVDGYFFVGYEGLYWHNGKFWFNEIEVRKVFNNGSLSLLLYGSCKKSIRQLRKIARPCKIKIEEERMPF